MAALTYLGGHFLLLNKFHIINIHHYYSLRSPMSTSGFFLHPWQSTVIISHYHTHTSFLSFCSIKLQVSICVCVCESAHTTWCTCRPQVSLGCHPSDTLFIWSQLSHSPGACQVDWAAAPWAPQLLLSPLLQSCKCKHHHSMPGLRKWVLGYGTQVLVPARKSLYWLGYLPRPCHHIEKDRKFANHDCAAWGQLTS